MSKLPFVGFLTSMNKNDFKRMPFVGFKEDYPGATESQAKNVTKKYTHHVKIFNSKTNGK